MPDILSPDDIRLQRIQALRQIGMPNAAPMQPPPIAPDAFGAKLLSDDGESKLQPVSQPQLQKVTGDASPVKPLNFQQREQLPTTTPEGRLAKLQDERANPWGTPENHPGTLGKVGHILATVGNIAGDVLAPGTMENIPGTDLNRRAQENSLQTQVQGRQKEAANESLAQQKEDSEEGLQTAQAKNLNSEADARDVLAKNPQYKTPQEGYAAAVQAAQRKGQDPSKDETVQQWADAITATQKETGQKAPSEEDKFISDYIAAHGLADTPQNRDKARSIKATELRPEQQPPRSMVAVPQPDGSLKMVEAKPGMTIPKGSETISEAGKLGNGGKPTADEQRRADLSENLNENLDKLEDIVNRRPDLFGPVAGRMTAMRAAVGTGDTDIAALETIKHQIGMAQISAHGMRSAQGIAAAADSILNGFHNSPDALKSNIQTARDSVKTFTQDVEKAKGGAGTAKVPSFADWQKSQGKQ